jgi:hypothetical protein
MTFEQLYSLLREQGTPAAGFLLVSPLLAVGLATLLPKPQERRWLLDVNLWLVSGGVLLLCLVLGYTLAIAGWLGLLRQLDLRLVLALPLALGLSLGLSRRLLPLYRLSAYRSLRQLLGLAVVGGVSVLLLTHMRFWVVTYIPPLMVLGLLVLLWYWVRGSQPEDEAGDRPTNTGNVKRSGTAGRAKQPNQL